MNLTPLEGGDRVRLPADWDEFFATPLAIGSPPADGGDEDAEETGDDLLYLA